MGFNSAGGGRISSYDDSVVGEYEYYGISRRFLILIPELDFSPILGWVRIDEAPRGGRGGQRSGLRVQERSSYVGTK